MKTLKTNKDVLANTPRKQLERDISYPADGRNMYHYRLETAVADLLKTISQREAGLIAEALYSAFQLGAMPINE